MEAAAKLPAHLLARASLRGNEYAWPLADIPLVIAAARDANLVSLGGQLQVRLPDGGICECYWVDVDTYVDVEKSLPWPERVALTARSALVRFTNLPNAASLVAEARTTFGSHLTEAETAGHVLPDLMCFVWDVLDEDQARAQRL